eukprot:c21240_g2_i1.p1 GENE.c21240_g2_i1~~c21240_g2_i1.p1  ORF type:complete len:609 (-),score=280.75 c21240_g2_i1:3-1829(-)
MMGVYEMILENPISKGKRVNIFRSRPIYKKAGAFYLSFDGNRWTIKVGHRDNSRIKMYCDFDTFFPWDLNNCSSSWQLLIDSTFQSIEGITIKKITSKQKQLIIEEEEKLAFCDIVVEGLLGEEIGANVMGLYIIQKHKLNARPVFKCRDYWLFFDSTEWCIKKGGDKPTSEISTKEMTIRCDSISPLFTFGIFWKVCQSGGFKENNKIKLRKAETEDYEKEDKLLTTDIFFYGLKEGDAFIDYMGVYRVEEYTFNDRPVYSHDCGGNSILLFFDGESWCVKSGLTSPSATRGRTKMYVISDSIAPIKIPKNEYWTVCGSEFIEIPEIKVRFANDEDRKLEEEKNEQKEIEMKSDVTLIGLDKNEYHFELMGLYRLTNIYLQDRPTYKHDDFWLYYDSGAWCVKSDIEKPILGKGVTLLRFVTNAYHPCHGNNSWTIFQDNEFQENELISIKIATDKDQRAEERRLKKRELEKKMSVSLSGINEGEPGFECMGQYLIQIPELTEDSEEIDTSKIRPHYKFGQFTLLFEVDRWSIYKGKNNPTQVMYVLDDSFLPPYVKADWKVFFNERFRTSKSQVKVNFIAEQDLNRSNSKIGPQKLIRKLTSSKLR